MKYKHLKTWRYKTKTWLVKYAGGKCQVCGYDRWHGNLAFHHVSQDGKDTNLADMLRNAKSWHIILEEVDKCILVCHNCHGEIHGGLIESPEVDLIDRAIKFKLYEDSRPIPKSHILKYCPLCGGRIRHDQKHCKDCKSKAQEKIAWPDNLIEMVQQSSKLAVSKVLGVSDKAIAKRLKKLAP